MKVKIDDALREIEQFNKHTKFEELLIAPRTRLVITLTRGEFSAWIEAEILKGITTENESPSQH